MTDAAAVSPAAHGARTLLAVLRLSTDYLGAHGSESPRLDAEVLAARGLGLRRIDLYLQFDRPLDEPELSIVRELVRRRASGEPVAYITGEREFFSRTFSVSPAVLIPRPETETLIDEVVRWWRARPASSGRVLDLGTGSGCIAVTLAAELPDARVTAGDASPPALAVAATNAVRHDVADRVAFVAGDWCAALQPGERFDAVVSNPPYITTDEMGTLPRDVEAHEPHLALDGGEDGLGCYRALMHELPQVLSPGGLVVLEVDPRRAVAVAAMLDDALPGATSTTLADLAGTPRCVVAVAIA